MPAKKNKGPAGSKRAGSAGTKGLPLLDLHGFLTEDVPDAVDRFLMAGSKKGVDRVRIMPGKGSGAVLKAVTAYLKLGSFPFEFERAPDGSKNEGVLIVFIGD